ncbi:VOC family protein [Undibacterium sp. TJN25]|uniref:VOC family protein n=1 Tax=Undibacterium sp. TJN25 TaxID=3413056 RepID=UPI003BF2E66C
MAAEQAASPTPLIREMNAYLRVKGAPRAIDFYRQAFGATELFRLSEPSGRIGHAELDIGGYKLMLSDEYPEHDIRGPESAGVACAMYLQVSNADLVVANAIAAGATVITPVEDQFYGERSGKLRDPFSHHWMISQTIKQVSPEEMQQRFNAMFTSA